MAPIYQFRMSSEESRYLARVRGRGIVLRTLGHHRQMDALVARLQAAGKRAGEWSELAVDRSDEMREWVAPLRRRAAAGKRVVTFFNNHYAGYAPGSVLRFGRLWQGE